VILLGGGECTARNAPQGPRAQETFVTDLEAGRVPEVARTPEATYRDARLAVHDPSRAMKRAAARTAAAWLTHGLLFGFSFLPSRHRPLRNPRIRTVVFVHGLAGNRANFFPLQAYLRARGHRRQLSFNYRSRGSIEGLALNLKRKLDRNVKGGRIDLVCHSMGGLVARYYVQALGGSRRVDRVVTLGTPHHGSFASAYLPVSPVTQLRPGSPFLRDLDALPLPSKVRFHSFAARDDLLVLPCESALATFGEAVMLEDLGHMDMLLSPRVFAAVHDRLTDPLHPPRVDPVVLGARA
jgi:pimeloyl-ACP methyl ester carboxylesterase